MINNKEIDSLIKAAFADGVLTDKERQIILKKAKSQGLDLDEIELILDAKIQELQNTNISDRFNSDVANIYNRYKTEFDAIQKTYIDQEFKPYTRTGKRGHYIDVEKTDYWGTKEAQKRYLLSIYPNGKEDTLAVLEFLLTKLPSYDDHIKYGNDLNGVEAAANQRIREIINKAKTEYASDEQFMSKIIVIQDSYNVIYSNLKQEQIIVEQNIKKRRKTNIVFVALLVLEWFLVGEGWGWCIALNVVTLIIFYFVVISSGKLMRDLNEDRDDLIQKIELFQKIK